jgi:hypothetical protein
MKRVMFALAATLVAGLAFSQAGPAYAPAENPFQGDYGFTLGQPTELRVDIQGIRLDAIALFALGEVRAGETVKCEVEVAGASVAEKKATLTVVLLLEDADGRNLERVKLEPFKVKPGKPFDERQKVAAEGSTLAAATRVYVFVQVAF